MGDAVVPIPIYSNSEEPSTFNVRLGEVVVMPPTVTPIPKESKLAFAEKSVPIPFMFILPGRNVILPPILTS